MFYYSCLFSDLLEEWNLFVITQWILRDGAQNMVAAFKQPGCYILDFHCLIHGIMLVIKSGLLTMASVKKLIEMLRKIVSHANMSNQFYDELWRYIYNLFGTAEPIIQKIVRVDAKQI